VVNPGIKWFDLQVRAGRKRLLHLLT